MKTHPHIHMVRWTPMWAITIPPFGIFIRREHADDYVRLLRHEMVHWDQYRRYGLVGFYLRYLWYAMLYGYRNNPMEVEAYGKE